MESEDDYDLQERKERVPAGTSDLGMGNKEYAANDKDFSTADREAKTWSGSGKYSRKAEFAGYVRTLWPYLVVIVFVFFGSLLTGYFSAASFPSMADTIMKGFSARFGPILTMSPLYIMITIFINNAFLSLLCLILGLALGVFPIIFIAFNGYFVGIVSYIASQQKGFLFLLLALLPHGIIELPMVFLSASIGLRLGYHVFLYLIGRPSELKKESIQGLKFYLQWIMPLLFVAAIIETFITPLILNLVRGT
jgi:stage II sporulation protein M